MSGRPPSSLRGRPPSSGIAGRPPMTRLGTGQVPGTGRPGTRGGQAGMSSTVLPAGIKVADRPMTQQGLSGMKTMSKGPQRQIQDRTYWLGEIRTKTNELTSEIRKVEGETRRYQEENNTYLMYEKRAESLAAEIAELQGQLHDYNMMIDRINMNQEITDMAEDLNSLKSRNEREQDSLERIFEQRQSMDQQIAKLDNEINREKMMTENRIQDMPSEMRQRYADLKAEGIKTVGTLEKLQDELDSVMSKEQQIEQSLQSNPVKMEAARLYEQLNELQEKHEQLEQEQEKFSSPEDEKEQLLARVKADNQEIASMERQSKELDEKMDNMRDEIQRIESSLEDQQDDSSNKYRELQKREHNMDEFLETFEENKNAELEEMNQLEQSNVALLEQISRNVLSTTNLPSVNEKSAMEKDLEYKMNALKKAEETSDTLTGENKKLRGDLTRVENLAAKIQKEIVYLEKKNEEMEQDLIKYEDIDQLHVEADQKKKDLIEEKAELEKRRDEFRSAMESMSVECDRLRIQLEENETHAQLTNLERKWQHLEQNNFALSEYIKSRSLDYKPVAIKADRKLAQLNKHLQEMYTKSIM